MAVTSTVLRSIGGTSSPWLMPISLALGLGHEWLMAGLQIGGTDAAHGLQDERATDGGP
jgi:hypothetical protein